MTIARLLCPTVVSLVMSAAADGAFAQTASLVEESGWRVTCLADGKCELGSTQTLDGRLITRLLIYKVGRRTLLEYLVPLRVNLQKGIILQIDGKRNFPTSPLYCDAPGCIGYAALTDDLLAMMKKGARLRVVFSPLNDERHLAFDYSLRGFTTQYTGFAAGREPATDLPGQPSATSPPARTRASD